jgi:hypothetical protein
MMQTFEGYDPASRTLKASPLTGDCMRTIIPREYVTCWTDSAAPICSGDLVRFWVQYPDEFLAIVKRLRVSRTGTWWGECSDGVFQIGTLFRPFAIEKVVALSDEPLIATATWKYRKADAEEAAHYAELATDVVREWRELGHVDGVPFPGLNRVNFTLADGSRNPEYALVPL